MLQVTTVEKVLPSKLLARPVLSYCTTAQLRAALLYRLRHLKGITVEQAAGRMMLETQTWYNYETGNKAIPDRILIDSGVDQLKVRGFKGENQLEALTRTLAEDYRVMVVEPWTEKLTFLQMRIQTLRLLVETETELA